MNKTTEIVVVTELKVNGEYKSCKSSTCGSYSL